MTRFITVTVIALSLIACTANAPDTATEAATVAATVATVGSADFTSKVLQAEQPVLVDFYADWCGPCKMQDPHLSTLSQKFAGKVQTYKLDIDAAGDIADQYDVRQIPTLIVFKDGKPANTAVGYHDAEQLRELYASAAN
jgi:thioredoxin 1